ncbi:MAG: MBL fold metallo-hydrolase [Bryobacteraceae bacterium]|nr:MBL fold metallo-hydrolase [Bryobacteraceae bacterium]
MYRNNFTRREWFQSASIAAGFGLIAPRLLEAGNPRIVPMMIEESAKAKITSRLLQRNISLVEGSGGNIAVLSGQDGKLIVDAGFRVSKTGIKAALDGIDGRPIKLLINTHWHTDHTDGNEWLHEAGATIIAHENTRKHLAVETRVDAWEYTFAASPASALPTKVFSSERKLQVNSSEVRMKYYTPAHTDSDIHVHFVEADILHVGDTWWNGVYPFIDYSTGGSIDGTIRAAEANIAMLNRDILVIPGHGEPGHKQDLVEFRDMLVGIRENVAKLKREGRSLNETLAAKPTSSYDAKWGQFLITPAMFTELVYVGV